MLLSQVGSEITHLQSGLSTIYFLAKRHRKLLYNQPCAPELAILKNELSRVRRVHISRVKQLDNPTVYLCRQCQNLLKNKKKLEDDLSKAAKTIESKLLSMDLHPETARAQTAALSDNSLERNLPANANVIVRQLKLKCLT